jgi:hypothetical protein
MARYRPDEAAVEETFVNRNAVSTLKPRTGARDRMLIPAQAGIPVVEYLPNLVKKTVVGTGHAAKEQVQMMVRMLLPGATLSTPDAADALAVAICHAHHRDRPRRDDCGGIAMIAKLSGRVDGAGDGWVVVDVGGVGYLVFCSGRTLARLEPGTATSLHVETQVREGRSSCSAFSTRLSASGSGCSPRCRASAPRWRWRS